MADSIVARLERLGWRRNAEGVLCQPPDCPRVPLKSFRDHLGTRYRLALDGERSFKRIWIRGPGGQIVAGYWEEE